MSRPTRREQRHHFDASVRLDLIEDDLDELEGMGDKRAARVTQLQLLAAGLLITVCTGIIGLFWAGVIGQ